MVASITTGEALFGALKADVLHTTEQELAARERRGTQDSYALPCDHASWTRNNRRTLADQ
ncbi:MAG: hypothetical protein CME06_13565 [Gemmatimonadetes bacterium]|nr:hypothetical protein [Gemmatimonadota bacterium]